ncbi:unnamed protein product [Bursaphelenchus okinawaensis]|uniref:RRM domain-containing protein n=1 Tax=Bursaphelenchus okinawaensis TaxID=465554 RepID=A0A811JUM8_9BILA|nr:unnamed protein product [Bursaphelenchus okinawaensis]CAG9084369.1 unnamed protein product [Bursaphelenchus okinawaensis]
MEHSKMVNAVSMESLDNCSTISSLEAPSQVRTLFVSGLPVDCKPRELYLLFRAYNGYENSLLKVTNKNGKIGAPVGFVTFATRQDADDACKKLQNVRFDPDTNTVIRLELAKSNTKVPKPKQPSPPIVSPAAIAAALLPGQSQPAQYLTQTLTNQTAELQGLVDHLTYFNDQPLFGLPVNPYSQSLHLLPNAAQANGHNLLNQQALAAAFAQIQQQQQQLPLNHLLAAAAQQAAPQVSSMNPPCTTLFVANLGTNVTEDEVRNAFKQYSGFSRIRMHHKGSSSSVAFVEYITVHHAAIALQGLQGYQLNNGNSIRIEYAKAKMGETNNNTANGIKADV